MKKPLIIQSPSLQSLQQRYATAIFTFIFWMIWIFLWSPLITLIGWLLGFDLFYVEIFELEGYESILSDMTGFVEWVAIIGGALATWALYNFLRFRDIERRTALSPVSNQQLSTFFNISEHSLHQHQHSQYLSVSFDEQGNITNVKNKIDPDRSLS